jgi:tetratricopeptide (TPR) repeat protein
MLRLQPEGQAGVTRRGSSLSVAKRRVALRTFGGETCFVPLQGERLYFKDQIAVETKSGDRFDVPVSFTYEAPATLPADWPDGDWCTSLKSWLAAHLAQAMTGVTPETLASQSREVSDRLSNMLASDLGRSSIKADAVSVRMEMSFGWQRTVPIPEIAKSVRAANPVIFIGLDGADWQLLDDYVANGTMPNLARLVREGASGVLETEHPPLSPLLWTTMMTGVSPLQHQILDFTHFNPVSGTKEPITSSERKSPAIWNMETMAGRRVDVFGLWATYPAEPVQGLMVSDRLFTFLFTEAAPPPDIVYPPSREAWARAAVSNAEGAVNLEAMKAYLPWLTDADYESLLHETDPYGKPASALRRLLVETEIYHRLALDVLSKTALPDLTVIYIQGTDTVGHVFAPFAPPKQPEISQTDYDRFHDVPQRYFASIDRFLGEIARIADATNATIMIASDHGFHWKEGRPVNISSFAVPTAAKWHRVDGIYLLRGRGIAPSNGHTGRAGIRRVCSTLLAATGLPPAEGIAGPPLPPLTNSNETIDYKRRFEPFAPPAAAVASSAGSDEALAKLRALGYIGSGETQTQRPAGAGSSTKTPGAYNNEGLVLKHEGRIAEAVAAFEKAMELDPKLSSAPWNLSDMLFERKQDLARSDDLLIRAVANGLPEAPRYAIERAIYYNKQGNLDRSLGLMERAVQARPDDADLRMFRGRYRVSRNECAAALDDFLVVQRMRPNDAVAWASAGLAEICLGDRQAATMYIRRSLELDPNQPNLRQFLGQ